MRFPRKVCGTENRPSIKTALFFSYMYARARRTRRGAKMKSESGRARIYLYTFNTNSHGIKIKITRGPKSIFPSAASDTVAQESKHRACADSILPLVPPPLRILYCSATYGRGCVRTCTRVRERHTYRITDGAARREKREGEISGASVTIHGVFPSTSLVGLTGANETLSLSLSSRARFSDLLFCSLLFSLARAGAWP